MLKKLLSIGLGMACLLVFNQADAWEYDKKAIMKEFNCKSGDTIRHAYNSLVVTKEDRVFENDTVKVETLINLGFDNVLANVT